MKLTEAFSTAIKNIQNLGYVLDIGFSYPYELIELFHIHDARKCIGIDLKRIENAVSCSLVVNEIAETTKIERRKISNLVRDCDSKRQLHNSYKLYTSLVLNKRPLDFNDFDREIELHYSKSIQEYLKNDNKWIPNYDIIIASKVLSHIDPNVEENGEWVFDKLYSKLSEDGIFYLRLNSADFKVEESNGISDSTILAPFDEGGLEKILSKIKVLHNEIITRDDGNREYIIIGTKKKTTYNMA